MTTNRRARYIVRLTLHRAKCRPAVLDSFECSRRTAHAMAEVMRARIERARSFWPSVTVHRVR